MTTKHTKIFIGLAIIGVAIFVAPTLFMNKFTNSDDIEIEEKQDNNNSKSFLIVDIDGDGFDFIPLQESKTYFDVDGDKLAEKTEWIKPGDAFLLASNSVEFKNVTRSGETYNLVMYFLQMDNRR